MFSIIMPTYNCEKYVEEAVKSIAAQTYDQWELIIVDDGSDDKTYQICCELAKSNERIHVFSIGHEGVSAARNYGIKQAKGDYVLFVDGDDTWESDLLQNCANSASENEMVLFGMMADFYTSDDILVRSEPMQKFNLEKLKYKIGKDPENIFSIFNMSSPCNKVYIRSVLIENEIAFSKDCIYLEDLKFNLDYLSVVNILRIIPMNFYRYRLFVDKKQITKRKFKELFVNEDSLMASINNFAKAYGKELSDFYTLQAIALKAYYEELLARAELSNDSEKRKLFNILNKNPHYTILLKHAEGKFFNLLRVFRALGFKKMQLKLIKRRYW